MRRWIWRALLLVAVMAALTVGAAAEEVRYPASEANSIRYDTTAGTVLGPSNQANITEAKILAEVNGTKITTIADDAFSKCSSLKTVEIASGIETIGSHAFSGCSALETVYFPNTVKEIGIFAFSGCEKLDKVILPSQLGEIKQGTFSGCGKLTAIYLPANVKNIGSDAFLMTPKTLILHREVDTPFVSNDGGRDESHRALLDPQPVKPAGCVTAGEERLVISCGTCDRIIIDQSRTIPATGHKPDSVEIPKVPATCVSTGTTAGHKCTVCGKPAEGLETIEIDPNNHKTPVDQHIDIPEVKPTCTEPGSTGGKRCPDCLAVTTQPTEVKADGHKYETKTVTIREATCSETGLSAEQEICSVCQDIKACETCEKLKDNEEAYFEHLKDAHNGEDIEKIPHTPGESKYVVTTPATCEKEGEETWKVVCSVCGEACDDDPMGELDHPARKVPALGHDLAGGIETITKQPTCTEPGTKDISKQACKREGCDYEQEAQTGIPTDPLGHAWKEVDGDGEIIKEATCTETGLREVGRKVCTRCDAEEKGTTEEIPLIAHKWKDPEPDEDKKDEDKAPTCGEEGISHVIVTCSACNRTEAQTITLPATRQHNYEGSEWTIVKKPTATEDGLQERPCMNPGCTHKDSQIIPATGEPSDPDNPTEPEESKTYQITLVQGVGGAVSASRSTAKAGDTVTLTIREESGYELDMLRVTDGSRELSVSNSSGDRYRFTMPAANVEVRVTFERINSSGWSGSNWASAPGEGSDGDPRRTADIMPTQNPSQSVPRAGAWNQLFQDIPTSHWAAGEIAWANQMGFMNGSGGRFNPDGAITHQQMWMVLARLTGSRPANMEEARRWAVQGGFADGSSPNGAVTRHQLVTALYRCAHLMGSTNRNTTSLAGYADSRTVPTVAREAFSWAVANGIVGGTASGRLDPNGTLTRAQFAVILYRYSQRI